MMAWFISEMTDSRDLHKLIEKEEELSEWLEEEQAKRTKRAGQE